MHNGDIDHFSFLPLLHVILDIIVGLREVVLLVVCTYIFFFQAEDGIRDSSVTGVQTCALPIWSRPPVNWRKARSGVSRAIRAAPSHPRCAEPARPQSLSCPPRNRQSKSGYCDPDRKSVV